jgi:hypothetical protein
MGFILITGVPYTQTYCTGNMVKTKKFIFARRFVGEPKEDDFKIVEEELPPLKQGGKITKKESCLLINLVCLCIFTSKR